MPDHILELAHGNARVAEAIRQILSTMAESGSEKMREMARDALAGAPLRELALSSVYGDELGEAFGRGWARCQALSASERADLAEAGKDQFGEMI
ncbi:hypothetical protein OHA21_35490 [Actinoplanes sp. NBC_00393]|uniref:hypothetical protein n=1 Tax=Actinoplanes sp. NBC_00393 TaxID=2975953 RepID=UPI002E24872D